MVNLRLMTSTEFKKYIDRAIIDYAQAKVEAGNWSKEESLCKSKEEYTKLLPDGEKTKDNYLFSIVNDNEVVGMVWLNKETDLVGFIGDINIFEKYQGFGYGKSAMQEIELFAKNLGIEKIELHVFGYNKRAINLYEKLEYRATNICMSKTIK